MRDRLWTGAILASVLTAGVAAAQDVSLPPNYGEVRGIGYPDPYQINLTAGGPERADATAGGCPAYVSAAPDVRYLHSATADLPLILSARSEADTVLIVNAPDGSWSCDDDSGEGANPSLRFEAPLSGAYDIWVGTYGPQASPATLSISELSSF